MCFVYETSSHDAYTVSPRLLLLKLDSFQDEPIGESEFQRQRAALRTSSTLSPSRTGPSWSALPTTRPRGLPVQPGAQRCSSERAATTSEP